MRSESLTDEQVSEQALALHSYVARGGDLGLWLASKGIGGDDLARILVEYRRQVRGAK